MAQDIKLTGSPNKRDERYSDSIDISHGTVRIEADDVTTGKKYCGVRIPTWVPAEMKEVFNLSWTMVVLFILNVIQQSISILFSGHLGDKELGGVSLANTVIKVAAVTIGNGLATACDTLFSQTYGSGNMKQVGMYLQRSWVIITLSVFPCIAILLNTNGILRLAGQDPKVAEIADGFCLVMLPAIFANHWYTILSRYIRNQGIIYPLLAMGIISLGINALAQYLLIQVLDLGTTGSGLAMGLGMFAQFVLVLSYILISKMYKVTWGGLTMELFQSWGPFLNLAIFGLLNVNLLWLGFEVGTIVAGTLGDVQLGAQSIIFQLEMITYCFAIGTGIGGNIRVGQLLGANKPLHAKRAVKAIYMIVLMQSVVVVIVLLSLKDVIPLAFSNSPEIIKLSSDMIPILALYTAFDQMCGSSSGILRGCGRQGTAALIIFVGMYIVGLPVGISLMLMTDLGTAGFWWGVTCSMVLQSIAFFVVVMRTDWEGEAEKAQIRAGLKSKSAPTQTKEFLYEDSETTALISDVPKQTPILRQRHFTGEYDTSQPDIAKLTQLAPKKLAPHELIFRRGLAILTCFVILFIGLFCRFTFTFDHETIIDASVLCISPDSNQTYPINGTTFGRNITALNISLPLCNSSVV
ncbi:multidrug and toxin extrusion protein 1-like [Lineus longissimus]|uniref:multidrug and toxin extrusion protein 1-like n=1 Tax=Lineus longissimus TaxID=88925 RepID=UPI002B4D3CA9